MPVRHGRMMVSPFTFYRGAAKIMAADLKDTPTAGLNVQLCGDAHLSNFGVYASPERDPGLRPQRLRRDAAGAVRVRREAPGRELHDRGAQQRFHAGTREVATLRPRCGHTASRWPGSPRCRRWTSGTPVCPQQDVLERRQTPATAVDDGQPRRRLRRRRRRDAEKVTAEGSYPRQPAGPVEARRAGRRPVPDREPASGHHPAARSGRDATGTPPRTARGDRFTTSSARTAPRWPTTAATCSSGFRSSTSPARSSASAASEPRVHRLAPGPRPAGPVVPPGQGGDGFGARGPLAEERVRAARRTSGPGTTDDAGRQRHLPRLDEGRTEANRYLYWRQLRDMKGSVVVEAMTPATIPSYARMCGHSLARAHARSGDRSKSPRTSARRIGSTSRSPISPSATPTRTTATTRRSPTRSKPRRLEALEGV